MNQSQQIIMQEPSILQGEWNGVAKASICSWNWNSAP